MWWLCVPAQSLSEVLIDSLGSFLGPGNRQQGKTSFDWLKLLFQNLGNDVIVEYLAIFRC